MSPAEVFVPLRRHADAREDVQRLLPHEFSGSAAKGVRHRAGGSGDDERVAGVGLAEHPGCSTKELAEVAGPAPSSACEHATVLREAGLITTVRHRNTALYSAIRSGLNLLNHRSDRPLG
jgi:hypothetical protein